MRSFQNSKYKPVEYLPLTTGQKWLLNDMLKFKHPGWATIEFLVKTKVPMDEEIMERALYYLLEKHESLRVKLFNKEGQWIQELYPVSEADAFAAYDFSNEDAHRQSEKVKQVCIKTRDWLLPSRGNLIKILFFKFSENEGRIWFCVHHVISDYVSLVLLSNEFMTTYNSLKLGKELKLQTLKDYRKWLYLVEGYSRDVLLPSELEYWVSLPWDKSKVLPTDYPGKFYNYEVIIDAISNKKLINSYRLNFHWMEQEETLRLINKYGVEFETVLIAVFFLAIANKMKIDWLGINVSYSGRNVFSSDYDFNANKLLGFLASVRVMLLNKPQCENILLEVENVMEQIKNIPNAGIGYILIRDQIKDEKLRSSFWNFRRHPEILFNYLGRVDIKNGNAPYEMIDEDKGSDLYPLEIKNTLLECVIGIRQNQLFLQSSYSEEYFKVETINGVMEEMITILREIVSEYKIEKTSIDNFRYES